MRIFGQHIPSCDEPEIEKAKTVLIDRAKRAGIKDWRFRIIHAWDAFNKQHIDRVDLLELA